MVTCPQHGEKLQLVGEAEMANGARIQWWGNCPGKMSRSTGNRTVICDALIRTYPDAQEAEEPTLFDASPDRSAAW